MPEHSLPADPRVSKGVISQFLRTNCRRQLYLSIYAPLHAHPELQALGLPPPAKWRPGIVALTRSGRDLEDVRFDELEQSFPGAMRNFATKGKGKPGAKTAFRDALKNGVVAPYVFVEGEFQASNLSAAFYAALNIDPAVAGRLPRLADLRPDVVLALEPSAQLPQLRRARQVNPDGSTAPLDETDTRLRLLPIDIKRSNHVNASYAIEVTLYAVLLALWIEHEGLSDKYAVIDQPALWTLDAPDAAPMSTLNAVPIAERIATLLARLELVEFDQYVISMRKIFREDLVDVATRPEWNTLTPHVGPYCGMCDFYAHAPWARKDPKTQVKETVHDEHCSEKVKADDLLSRIPDVSRGMARTLGDAGVGTVTALSQQSPDAPVFQSHNRLAAERQLLPRRAAHLLAATRDSTGRQCASLPRYSHLSAYIFLNFDAATGFTTGFSVYGNFRAQRNFGSEPKPYVPSDEPKQRPEAWTVERREMDEEFKGLQRVMYYLADLIDKAQADPDHEDVKKATLQVYFWDARQFEHFRTVVGRHLHRLLGDARLNGLVWLFPPEEILAHPEYALTPAVSFVRDAIRRLEILPIPYVQTLLAVGAVLLPEADHPKIPPFLHEPLSDAIPKERIYEIWEPQHHGNHQDQVAAYNQTLRNLVMTLMKVTIWVQRQYKGRLTADAPPLELMKLPNYRGVSVDGQLLILHAKLEQQIEATSNKVGYGCDADELEAGYRSIRLTQRLTGAQEAEALAAYSLTDEDDLRVYAVTETSCNSKLKTGDAATFFFDDEPGVLNQRVSKYLSGSHDDLGYRKYIAMAAGLQVDIRHFDRVGGRVVVAPGYFAAVTQALIDDGLDLDTHCSLVDAPPFSEGAYRKEQFIRRLGNPAIAYPHSQAMTALGKQTSAPPKPSKDAPTRGASVLWDAPNVAIQSSDWSPTEISAAIDWLRKQGHLINPSQEEAIRAGLDRCLSLIWGPPGTGKTTTGAGIAAAELWLAMTRQVPQKLLITGPNYQAVENFYADLLPLFEALGPDACRVRWVERREEGDPEQEATFDYRRCGKLQLAELRAEMEEGDKPTIVFAVAAQLFNLANLPSRTGKKSNAVPALELFDLVMVDEASQVDVASAIGALAELAPNGRLVLLGDHLQMPPIAKVEPPKGCEHIVGSILDYFQVRFSEIEPQPLLENYRSAEGLVRFARELGYPAKLSAKFPDSQLALAHALEQPINWPDTLPWSPLFPALLNPALSTLAVTYADGKSGQANEFEASLVVATVLLARESLMRGLSGRTEPRTPGLDAQHFWTETVGIVTPHRAQRAAVIRGLRGAFPAEEGELIEKAVDTVERFQGGERDLILVSFGVGDPDVIEAEEEFLLGLNRTNVAISRARAKAIVFVSDDLSYHLPDDADVVRTARAIKGFVHQYCDQTQRFGLPAGDGVRPVTLRWHP